MSSAAAGFIAQVAFWVLLPLGAATRELSPQAAAIFLAVYLAALFGGSYRPYWLPFSTCVAVLDVVLVFMVAKRDIRLS
jgi:TctA family transporter